MGITSYALISSKFIKENETPSISADGNIELFKYDFESLDNVIGGTGETASQIIQQEMARKIRKKMFFNSLFGDYSIVVSKDDKNLGYDLSLRLDKTLLVLDRASSSLIENYKGNKSLNSSIHIGFFYHGLAKEKIKEYNINHSLFVISDNLHGNAESLVDFRALIRESTKHPERNIESATNPNFSQQFLGYIIGDFGIDFIVDGLDPKKDTIPTYRFFYKNYGLLEKLGFVEKISGEAHRRYGAMILPKAIIDEFFDEHMKFKGEFQGKL